MNDRPNQSRLRPVEINGRIEMLAPNEWPEEHYRCPMCRSKLITNYGPGISISFCTNCGYSNEDYD